MTTKIEVKNICPVIGMISSGKSSILNTLLNEDFFEVSEKVTTKIVTIIRYNSKVTKPIFFKLNLVNNGNDNYTFYKKNDSEISETENIKKKIIELNKEELQKKEPNYEDIFYLQMVRILLPQVLLFYQSYYINYQAIIINNLYMN